MRTLLRPLLIAYLFVSIAVAFFAQRSDALLAWEQFRHLHFGLLVPLLCLALTTQTKTKANPIALDEWRMRLGQSKRNLALLRLVKTSLIAFVVGTLALLLGRLLTAPLHTTRLDPHFAHDLGVGAVTTTTYIALLGAATRFGIGSWGSLIALGIDLTMGHGRDFWSLLTPHRHVVEMLDAHGIIGVATAPSSAVLLGLTFASTLWIIART